MHFSVVCSPDGVLTLCTVYTWVLSVFYRQATYDEITVFHFTTCIIKVQILGKKQILVVQLDEYK